MDKEFLFKISTKDALILNCMIDKLVKVTKERPITAAELIWYIYINVKDTPKITQVDVRRYINIMRTQSLVPVCATSKGYYVSYDKLEIERQIDSLLFRTHGIMNAVEGLQKMIE